MPSEPAGGSTNNEDAFPIQQLSILALCRLAEPVAFMSIISYSFPMVQEIKGEKDASFYSGLLVSAFAVAESISAMFWGSVSDRYGRKPIILVALIGTAISSLLFGVAKNYWFALFARVIGGLLNGNVAVMQTMVAEMVKNPKHEPKAYAMQPFMWSVGSIAGSALGGYTAQPARFYPGVFSKDGLFGQYPYLLPNLISVSVIIVSIILGVLFLKETNPRFQQHEESQRHLPTIDETTPLNPNKRTESVSGQRRPSFVAASMPCATEPSYDIRRASIVSIGSIKGVSKLVPNFQPVIEEIRSVPGTPEESPKAFNSAVVMWIVASVFMCYHQMAYGSIVPIYVVDAPQHSGLDLTGGLGLTIHDVGTFLAINSVVGMLGQGFFFPIFVGWLGIWKSIVIMTLFSPLIHFATPFTSALSRPDIGIIVMLALANFATIVVYPTLLIMLKNATNPNYLGKVNGVAASSWSMARTIAPPVVGLFYSTLGSAAAWWSCGVVSMAAVIQLYFLQRMQNEHQVPNSSHNDEEAVID